MPEQEKKGLGKWDTIIKVAKGAAEILAAVLVYQAGKKNSGK